jgi:CubicO group peptidase (beta-lactamase class C family)
LSDLAAVVVSLGVLPGAAWGQSTPASSGDVSAVAPAPLRYGAVIEESRRLVQADLIERGYPGIAIAIAVSVGGETAWSEGFGYADL